MKDAGQAPRAAEMLKITAKNALRFGIVDGIIPEPEGGAHRDLSLVSDRIKAVVVKTLRELMQKSPETLKEERFQKYIQMGSVAEVEP